MRRLLVGLSMLFTACSSSAPASEKRVAPDSSVNGPEACVQAGGQCMIGSAIATGACPVVGPQDCNPDRNPGGAVCCLSADAGTSTGACRWPASLDDAGPGGCRAARALVECSDSSGAGCGCLSNDPTTCAGCTLAGATCHDLCSSGEYAVDCGQIGGGQIGGSTTAEPPSGCKFAGANPGSTASYCCPCG